MQKSQKSGKLIIRIKRRILFYHFFKISTKIDEFGFRDLTMDDVKQGFADVKIQNTYKK